MWYLGASGFGDAYRQGNFVDLARERNGVVAKTKPVDIGTKAETNVVNWAKTHGFWRADRLTKTGVRDRGDVKLTDTVMIQVKSGYTQGREPSDFLIGQWLAKVDEQMKMGGWEIGLLTHHRAGKGSPDMWRWYLSGEQFARLLGHKGVGTSFPQYVQLQGYMVPPLLHSAGIIA